MHANPETCVMAELVIPECSSGCCVQESNPKPQSPMCHTVPVPADGYCPWVLMQEQHATGWVGVEWIGLEWGGVGWGGVGWGGVGWGGVGWGGVGWGTR